MAEYVFSSRERTMPVRFHRRKRREFLAGVEEECSTGCALARMSGAPASRAAAALLSPATPAPAPSERPVAPCARLPVAPARLAPCIRSCSARRAASTASSSS
eukprot:scaffold232302_cov32-Tisochrysis_lutea.AAC.3